MSLFRCPICSAPLTRGSVTYTCPNGHSYDISKEGYVHLLPPTKCTPRPLEMTGPWCRLPTAFSRRDTTSRCVPPWRSWPSRYAPSPAPWWTRAVGEGYYTAGIAQGPAGGGPFPAVAGIDISKFALRWAAKRDRGD